MGTIGDHQRSASSEACHQLADPGDLSVVGYDTSNSGTVKCGIVKRVRQICVINDGHDTAGPVVSIVPISVLVAARVSEDVQRGPMDVYPILGHRVEGQHRPGEQAGHKQGLEHSRGIYHSFHNWVCVIVFDLCWRFYASTVLNWAAHWYPRFRGWQTDWRVANL